MANLGVHIYEQATSVQTPKVAAAGIHFVVGTAPVQPAANPAKSNVPVLATSWDEAVEKLGFSYDWDTYSLCEFMYSHFQLFGAQPVIFCNILDPATMKQDVGAADYDVADHKISLPVEAVAGSIQIKVESVVETNEGNTLAEVTLLPDEDYSVFYERDDTDTYVCIVELLEDGIAYDAATVNISYTAANPQTATVADVVDGVAQADACLTAVGVVPDLICAPGWSHNTVIAAVMATKASAINGLFKGKALIDADSSADGVTEYSQLSGYKNKNSFVDVDQILCWPMVQLGDYRFHLSTQLCGLIVQLGTNEWHDVALYLADQYFDGVTRTEELEQVRFEMSIRPTEINQGTIQTASAADASGTYSVCKYTVYKAGEKVIDIDQFNQIHDVNGVDNAANVRKALGMM